LIDEKGNIVTTFEDTPSYCAPFADGVSFYLKSATDFTIIDTSGKVLYKNDSTASAPLQLMGYANGHFVVAKYEASFDKTAWYLGTIGKTGAVKNEFKAITEKAGYSSSNSFLEPKIREIYKEGYNHRNNFEYLGENIVNFGRKSGIYYSLDTNQVKYNSAYDVFSKFSDGKMLVVYNGTIFVGPDLDFDKATAAPTMPFYATGDIGDGGNISEGASSYSEGLAFGRLKDSPFTKGYYDTNGNLAFSLGFLSGNDFSGGIFSGGYAPILAKGADGKSYLTVIDKSGNKQYELLAVDKCDIDQSANGYVAATIGGKSIIVDPKGSVKTPGTDDLSGISNTSFGNVSGGFFIIDKTYVSLDGKTIIKDILEK
jgi:hypothetical protein